jgi:hypothetical protein
MRQPNALLTEPVGFFRFTCRLTARTNGGKPDMNNELIDQRLTAITNVDSFVGALAREYWHQERARKSDVEIDQALTEFELRAQEAKTRRIDARRQQEEQDQRVAEAHRRERAYSAAKEKPLSALEIVCRLKDAGFQIRLSKKGELQVSPVDGIPLELVAYVEVYADRLRDFFVQRSQWRTVA